MEEEKEQHKEEREAKRLAKERKEKGKGKSRNVVESDGGEGHEEGDSGDEDINTCPKCGEKSGANHLWIGCHNCPRWYHKRCLGFSVCLSLEEIEAMDFHL